MARQVICLFYCSGTKSHTVILVVGVADVVNAVENFRKVKNYAQEFQSEFIGCYFLRIMKWELVLAFLSKMNLVIL